MVLCQDMLVSMDAELPRSVLLPCSLASLQDPSSLWILLDIFPLTPARAPDPSSGT